MRKYEFTGETKEILSSSKVVILHRIRAVSDFGTVKAGDLGGWIEKEENLSHDGLAWVYDNATVYDNAIVCDNAFVYDDVNVCNNAVIRDNASVCNNALIYGNAIICGNACIGANARIRNNAIVSSTNHILVIGPIGSRKDFITFYRDQDNDITVSCGCFNRKIDKFLEKVSQIHGDSKHALTYRAAVELAKLQIDVSL